MSTSPPASVTIHPASGKVCAGSPAAFTASTLYAGTNPIYQWTLNGSNVGSNNPVYTGSGFANNDQLVCKINNGAVCEPGILNATDAITIHVDNNTIQPKITIAASNMLICNCSPVMFNATVLNGGSASLYQWKVNGAVIEDNDNKFITSSLMPGDIINCVYTDSTSCILNDSAFSNNIQMTTGSGQPASIIIAASDTNICKGTSVMFTATPSNAGVNPFFQWKINGISTGANSNTFASANLSNGDIINCAVTPDIKRSCIVPGNANSNNIVITVNDKLPATINISTSSDTICAGQTIIFNASVSNAGNNPFYQWKANGINAGTNSNQFSSSTLSNGDVIACTLIPDQLSVCTNTISVTSGQIQITLKTGVIPSVNITASANEVCSGDTIDFTAMVQNAGGAVSYQWMINNEIAGNNSLQFSSSQLSNGDVITCVVDATNSCSVLQISSNAITAIINALPVINIIPKDTIVTPGSIIRLNAIITGDIMSFQWSPEDKINNPLVLQPLTVALTDNTSYNLTAESDKGCKASASAIIKIFRTLVMPNAFTPNGDGINDIFRIPAGMVLSIEEFSLFNRFGENVFSTRNPAVGWDGTYKGEYALLGVYVYVIKGKGYNGELSTRGSFVLIR